MVSNPGAGTLRFWKIRDGELESAASTGYNIERCSVIMSKDGPQSLLKSWAEKVLRNVVKREGVEIVGTSAARRSGTPEIEKLASARYTDCTELDVLEK